MSKTESVLTKVLLILFISIFWNFIVPGLVAYWDDVFFSVGIKNKLDIIEGDLSEYSILGLKKFRDFEDKKARYEQKISDIEKELTSNNVAYGDIRNLINIKETYSKDLTELKRPVKIVPFFESQTQFYFTFITFFLGLCIFLANPPNSRKIDSFRLIAVTTVIYLSLQSTNWFRNFAVFEEFRPVFSFAHYDISRTSFYLQELRALVICFLISLLWRKWIVYHDHTIGSIKDYFQKEISIDNFNDLSSLVVSMFSLWQINMIIIVLAFFPWTFFYWNNFLSLGDNRFIISALFIHICWIISWSLISAPLIYTFYKWNSLKTAYLSQLSTNQSEERNIDRIIEFVKDNNPLTSFQLLGAGVVSVITFLLPLANLLFK